MSEFKNFFKLKKELKVQLPNIIPKAAYINKDNELIIKANSSDDYEIITKEDWTKKAFVTGITKKKNDLKLYLAILNIDTDFDVEDDVNKQEMFDEYKINKMTRIMNR